MLLVGRSGMPRLLILSFIETFSAVPIRILAGYFMGVEKIILTFILGGKGLRMASVVLKKKSKTGGLMLPDFDSV